MMTQMAKMRDVTNQVPRLIAVNATMPMRVLQYRHEENDFCADTGGRGSQPEGPVLPDR